MQAEFDPKVILLEGCDDIHATLDWRFTITEVRIKLKSLYPEN
jgi:hypothetical protein